jgi:hypothetical protein
MKKLLFFLFLFVHNSTSATGKYLTKQMLDKEPRKNLAQMSNLEKFVRHFDDRGQHERVTRWFKVENSDDQQKIINQEKYKWHNYANTEYPKLWPTMIHCFSKEIDQKILDYAFFREVVKNQHNQGFDNSAYATVMAAMYYRNPVTQNILPVPGLLEFGYNISDGQLYHRCFRGIGWDGFQESLAPVKVYSTTQNCKFNWNVNNLESSDFQSEKFPDLITRVYKPKTH